jgi:tetratricopeptide (TPR) repeat protein/tRNA A-37 threonylcarbamoyl transferase component Bud32
VPGEATLIDDIVADSDDDRPRLLSPGTRVGRYEVRRLLRGTVYVAHDHALDREIALEVVDERRAELHGGAKISHPAVIKVFDVGRDGDRFFIATELVIGETLAAYIQRARPSWRQQVTLFEQVARGLSAAHAAGVAHHDFGLDDVWVESRTGRAVVGNLGGSRDVDADIVALAAAMSSCLKPHRLPSRLVLALDKSWPSMDSFATELAAIRGRARRVAIRTAIALSVISVGAIALLLSRSRSTLPCAQGFAELDAAVHRPALVTALVNDPATLARITQELDFSTLRWRVAHAATCVASRNPSQPAPVAECLEARRVELAGVTSDIANGVPYAANMMRYVGDPALCIHPPASVSFVRVPADPAARRAAAQLRHRVDEIETVRGAGDFARAVTLATTLVHEAEGGSPILYAEAIYSLGATQSLGGNAKDAAVSLRKAAAIAESVHYDYIVEQSWIQLAFLMTGDEGDQARASEYISYADAALERLGRPEDDDALFSFVKGTVLVDTEHFDEAEVALKRAIELATRSSRETLAHSVQGLAYLYEARGRLRDAISTYRDALTHLSDAGPNAKSLVPAIEARLAVDLASVGETRVAVELGRDAVALSDAMLTPDNVDRMFAHGALAQALDDDRLGDEALAEAEGIVRSAERVGGDRSERYAEALTIEAEMLVERKRFREARALDAKACHIFDFVSASGSMMQSECNYVDALALVGLKQFAPALALLDQVVPGFQQSYGPTHPEVAVALLARGKAHAGLGDTTKAIADFEAALQVFEHSDVDVRYAATVRAAYGKVLWSSDRERAVQLVRSAVATLKPAPTKFGDVLAESETWLASH